MDTINFRGPYFISEYESLEDYFGRSQGELPSEQLLFQAWQLVADKLPIYYPRSGSDLSSCSCLIDLDRGQLFKARYRIDKSYVEYYSCFLYDFLRSTCNMCLILAVKTFYLLRFDLKGASSVLISLNCNIYASQR